MITSQGVHAYTASCDLKLTERHHLALKKGICLANPKKLL
jgi:hypothetical protein